MKRLLCFLFLISNLITTAAAQFSGYEGDAWRVYSLIDTNDTKQIKILEESIRIIEVTIDTMRDQLKSSIHLEERRLNLAASRILVAIYNNLDRQIPLYKEKVALIDTLQQHLKILEEVSRQDRSNYYRKKKELGFNNVFRKYKRANYKSQVEEEQLTFELRWILNNDDKRNKRKDILGEFINYFTLVLTGIDEATVQPMKDSLNNVIQEKIYISDSLTHNGEQLKSEIRVLKEQRETIEKNKVALTLALEDKTRQSKIQDSLLRNGQEKSASYEKRLKEVESTLQERTIEVNSVTANMRQLRQDKSQMEKELDKKRFEISLEELKNDSLKSVQDSLGMLVNELKATYEAEISELIRSKELKNSLLFILLGFLGVLSLLGYSIKQSRDVSKEQAVLLQTKTTELRLSNTQLQDKTNELKLSHKELQHRTKNNLQKIINLIYIKKFAIKDKKARAILQLLQDELDTIALIHQKLYVRENQKLTIVNVADYVDELVRYLVGKAATVYTEVADIFIEMDNAVEIGLILNELVTNARKYSFPEVTHPEISVKIDVQEQFIFMTIKDNGNGFPTNTFTIDNATFGLMSIADVVKRHENKGSTIQLYNDNGAVVKLQLPFDKELGRLTA